MSLTEQVYFYAGGAGIHWKNWHEFMRRIQYLNEHNSAHYEHSLRVGLYAHKLALVLGNYDSRFALYAGCGHDIGKCGISNAVLDAADFGEEEMALVRAHPQHGYEMLRDTHLFTALVAGMHHAYQESGYGINLDEVPVLNGIMKAKIERMARHIMICDFFDAMTTRKTKFPGDVRDVMMKKFPDKEFQIDYLLKIQIA